MLEQQLFLGRLGLIEDIVVLGLDCFSIWLCLLVIRRKCWSKPRVGQRILWGCLSMTIKHLSQKSSHSFVYRVPNKVFQGYTNPKMDCLWTLTVSLRTSTSQFEKQSFNQKLGTLKNKTNKQTNLWNTIGKLVSKYFWEVISFPICIRRYRTAWI